MKIFKFGGASVNSASAVKNMAHIVQQHLGDEPLAVVVSAMGKSTNMLERLVPGVADENERQLLRQEIETYHRRTTEALMPTNGDTQTKISRLLAQLDTLATQLTPAPTHYNYNYDQVVARGELLSTTIIADYLNHLGINTLWVDARHLLRTDNHHREGRIDWNATSQFCHQQLEDALTRKKAQVILTQGFIASADDGSTSTLGREGSDYSASILAYCLNAESVTIWKDVPGFLNADPKFFKDTVKISKIPYNEAIELAYYGASVIHPKTVKPIQNKNIPLYIRSFLTPDSEGSAIGDYMSVDPETPLYIFKNNQILLSITPKDFSFIAEENLQTLFGYLNTLGIKVNMMQNSALSFSICIDHNPMLVGMLTQQLKASFHVRYNEHLQLITIRYYTQEVIDRIVAGRPILLEQRSRTTEQLIVPESATE